MTRLSVLHIATNRLIVDRLQNRNTKKWMYAINIKKNGLPHLLVCESKCVYDTEIEARKDAGQLVKTCRNLFKSGEIWE